MSRRIVFLTTIHAKVEGFNILQELYAEDISFGKIFVEVSVGKCSNYVIHNSYMFCGFQLYVLDRWGANNTEVAWKGSLRARQNFGLGLIKLLLAQANKWHVQPEALDSLFCWYWHRRLQLKGRLMQKNQWLSSIQQVLKYLNKED